MNIINNHYRSQQFDDRNGNAIDILVIHSTHVSFKKTIDILCGYEKKVSCHYVIDLDGTIYNIVPEVKRAWHAGESFWRGRSEINNYSIGIEIVDVDIHDKPIENFTIEQMNATLHLSKEIVAKYNILPFNVVAHSDISPSRKDDPGEMFDWHLLASNDIGMKHYVFDNNQESQIIAKPGDNNNTINKIQQLLSEYGYHITNDGIFGNKMKDVILAFKRHFYPQKLNHLIDENALVILENIVEQVRSYNLSKKC